MYVPLEFIGLSSLLNYTTLKREYLLSRHDSSLSSLLNYTTLKLHYLNKPNNNCLSSLLNYTTLKPQIIWENATTRRANKELA